MRSLFLSITVVGAIVFGLLISSAGGDSAARSEFPVHSPEEWNNLAVSVGYDWPTGLAPGTSEAEPVIQYIAACLSDQGISTQVDRGGVQFDGDPADVAECYYQLAVEADAKSAGTRDDG